MNMDNNNVELEELFGEESQRTSTKSQRVTPHLNSESSSSTKKKKQINDIEHKFNSIMMKSVLPAFLTGAVCLFVGAVAFRQDNSAAIKVQTAKTIKQSSDVLDNLDNVQSSQIEALKKQLSDVTAGKDEARVKDENSLKFINDVNKSSYDSLDPFFNKLVALQPTASEEEVQLLQQDLKQYMTDSAATSELYDILKGPSAAKELGAKTVKSAGVVVSMLSVPDDNSKIYAVSVPIIAKDEKSYNSLYVVKMNNTDNKILEVRYAGYATGAFTNEMNNFMLTKAEAASKDGQTVIASSTEQSSTPPSSETQSSTEGQGQ